MNTQGRKAKGRSLVLEVKQWLHNIFPQLVDHDIIVPAASASGADLVLSPECQKVFPFAVECKRQEGLSKVYAFVDQAKQNANGLMPVVIARSNRKEAIVILTLTDFEKLIGEQ